MEADLPQSESEAREHIRYIRREKGLGDGNEQIGHNASDLEAALNVLSHDLYQTTTHFLLELIQNADDNSYSSDVIPTLSITYSTGRIRIDCNERGFGKQNVEAICRICKSTKSGRSKSAGFVGEKGIGFKAVFKVASKVWISSGHYQFRFDRDGHLGMIAPIWDTFPAAKSPRGGTSIILELDPAGDESSIVDELAKYDPKILMFLRRLRRIEINVTKSSWKLGGKFKTVLSRQDKEPNGRAQIVMLYRDGVKTNYLTWRHMVNYMPSDPRRPGITSSEIVLGFPLTANEDEPILERQDVYAFLPVKSIGFKFLIQGDFLLTANREEFHAESIWNATLVGAASTAFVDAVSHMARLPTKLRYTWIRFAHFHNDLVSSRLFDGLPGVVKDKLRKTDILEAQDGQYRKPPNMVYIPDGYRDRAGQPLIEIPGTHHLSKKYGWDTDSNLVLAHTLGVQCMDATNFQKAVMNHLGRFSYKAFYKGKDKEWHSDFCKALNNLDSYFFLDYGKDLYLVPLANGKWVRPTEKFVYLPPVDKDEVVKVPQGLNLTIADEEAISDSHRRSTCQQAGLRELTISEIKTLILDGHDTRCKTPQNFKPASLSAQALVSHALFLFETGWRRTGEPRLYMASDLGGCRRSKDMYFQSDLPSSARRVLVSGPQKTYGFLHSAYTNAAGGDASRTAAWHKWMSDELTVATFPRLCISDIKSCSRFSSPEKFLHSDFAALMKSRSTIEWLVILRDGWDDYQTYLREPLDPNKTRTHVHNGWMTKADETAVMQEVLVNHFRGFQVPRTGRYSSMLLSEGYQPTPWMVREYRGLAPLMELPDPEHKNWGPLLGNLRVPRAPTTGFYVECLRSARHAGDSVDTDKIRSLMAKLDGLKSSDTPPVIRKLASRDAAEQIAGQYGSTYFHLFNKPHDRLICIPEKDGSKRQWVSAQSCYWAGDSWLSGLHCLSDIYPEFEIMFRHHIQVPDIGSWHLTDELSYVCHWSKHSTARIERLLLGLVHHQTKMEAKLSAGQIKQLQEEVFWPIVSGKSNEPFDSWQSAGKGPNWLIADRAFFRDQFDGILPVLAFSSDMIYRLMPLLEAAGLQDKMLSRVASNVIQAAGDAAIHEALTEKYRSRTSYLVRLMPDLQHDRDHIRDKFGNVEVYLASSILQHWNAPLGVQQVQSRTSEGVALLESDYAGDLRIYLKTGYDAEPFPLELADQLTDFFNIPADKKDLVNVVLTAGIDRIDRLFDEKGIPPLLEDIPDRPQEDYEDPPEVLALARTHTGSTVDEKPKNKLGSSQSSRFTRLVAHKRFASSATSFSEANQSISSLPSYHTAIGKPSKNRSSLKDEKKGQSNPVFYSLDDVEQTLKDMKFQQHGGIVKAKLPEPQGLIGRVKNYMQRDNDAAEAIACDVLSTILGQTSDEIYSPRSNRKARPAFSFVDKHGKFSSFLQRLEGSAGRGQGYNRFSYVVDAKATSRSQQGQWQFNITQGELDRFRRYSMRAANASGSSNLSASTEVSVLVVVADPRKEPKMLFVPDPWDLYNEGQLHVSASAQGTYTATLGLGVFNNGKGKDKAGESGFDAVQVRPHHEATWVPEPPPLESEKPMDIKKKN